MDCNCVSFIEGEGVKERERESEAAFVTKDIMPLVHVCTSQA